MRLQRILGSFINRLNNQNIDSKRFLKIKINNYLIINKSFYCKKDLVAKISNNERSKINFEKIEKPDKPVSQFYASIVRKSMINFVILIKHVLNIIYIL
jgi:hypothetical protein